jgi:type IV pilus assembly protein PilN
MIPINLLPHREERRKEQRKRFVALAAMTLVVGAVIVGAVHSYFGNRIQSQVGRNDYLQNEIAILDRQIEEIKKLKEQTEALLGRKQVVESLQSNRSETVRLLDQLVRQIPDGVYLKSVKQTGNRVNVSGYATSNARVSTLMRNLEASPWLESPSLVEIKASIVDKQQLNEFIVNVNLTREKADQVDAGQGQNRPPKG